MFAGGGEGGERSIRGVFKERKRFHSLSNLAHNILETREYSSDFPAGSALQYKIFPGSSAGRIRDNKNSECGINENHVQRYELSFQ